MSDTIGSERGAGPGAGPAGPAGPPGLAGPASAARGPGARPGGLPAGTAGPGATRGTVPGTAHEAVNEAYSFACMNCGYGWEQAYRIEHHTDTSGRPYVTYLADGAEVPSPLTRPTCGNCDGHHVRIMRSGQVADAVARRWTLEHGERGHRGAGGGSAVRGERGVQRARHWPALHFLRRRPVPPATAAPAAPDPGAVRPDGSPGASGAAGSPGAGDPPGTVGGPDSVEAVEKEQGRRLSG